MADTLQSAIADPGFQKLKPEEQVGVLTHLDSEGFGKLGASDQQAVLEHLVAGSGRTIAPSPIGMGNQALTGGLHNSLSPIKPPPSPIPDGVNPIVNAATAYASDLLPAPEPFTTKPLSVAREHELNSRSPMGSPSAISASVTGPAQRIGEGDVAGGIGQGAATITKAILLKRGAQASTTPPSTTASLENTLNLPEKLGPRIVNIEGVDMPVLTSERVASEAGVPATGAGRLQQSLKRGGIGEKDFARIEETQQNAVKQVIKNVAQRTSGFIGPLPESPAAATQVASDTVFQQARPIYQALDASLTHVPFVLDDLEKIAKPAIARAEKFGVQLNDAWNPDQPLQSLQTIRSGLLNMQRSTADAAARMQMGEEIGKLSNAIEGSLGRSKIPGLLDNWRSANSLWARGHALRDVADSLEATIKGTPAEVQVSVPGEITPQLPEVRATSLVQRLNDLDKIGTLDKAFGEGYSRSIRQVADFLDKAQRTPIGSFGLGTSAASAHGAGFRLGMKVLEKLGGDKLAQIMTDTKGARVVANLTGAKTPAQVAARAPIVQQWAARLPAGSYQAGPVPAPQLAASTQALAAGLLSTTPLEGEYLPSGEPPITGPTRRVPQATRPIKVGPSSNVKPLAGDRQLQLPAATSRQLPNISDSTSKLLSETHGYTNVADVMEAAKNGTISTQLAARIAQKLRGKAASITRPIHPPSP